jgi:superfamily II DNA helicase RecQ
MQLKAYSQDSGRAGRDGEASETTGLQAETTDGKGRIGKE